MLELKCLSVYHTSTGKLRAKVRYHGQVHTLKIENTKKGEIRVSSISAPTYLTSFEIQKIQYDDNFTGIAVCLIRDGVCDRENPVECKVKESIWI